MIDREMRDMGRTVGTIGCQHCEILEPHTCLTLPFDDDRDVTPAEKAIELDLYIHGR